MTSLSEHDFAASNFSPVSGLKNPNDVIVLSPLIISITAIILFLYLYYYLF